ncbi:NAD-dependent epimerase/dehydratase family protein [Gordonia sp. LSe1-13]|uniref:NAD-dependent epimerase/dehydratase family protein n=1 Tax=Gordonia sesuvii TaxID=3116777 RepID=A0ABU7M9F6_9ACTN|nr:NAD-dependent epimerase/dehydratase family protein [Gordonia sp. LSe1-13]
MAPVLVVGATGKTGRRVADLLARRGHPVRGASRSSATRFDWTDRSTWMPALTGVGPVYISYQPDLIVPGATDDIAEFVRMAESAGVTRLVLLAGRGEPEAAEAGRLVHESRIESTVLSCAWFDQNFSEGGFAPEVAMGSLTLPVPAVGEPFIDADDIAEVAVAALLDDSPAGNPHAGRTYELTGPRLLTFADVAAEIGRARGTEIAYTRVGLDDYRELLQQFDVPDAEIGLLLALFGTLFDGRNSHVSDDVARVLGRPATDFSAFAESMATAPAHEDQVAR